MKRGPAGHPIMIVAGLWASALHAGEIAGLPSQAPPFLQRDFEIDLSNDFLGRGGGTDDFRTQQVIVTARSENNWLAVIDHSILTLGQGNEPGRIDQLSASLGYQLIANVERGHVTKLAVGAGFRSTREFAGSRIQNGFHRLIGSEIETMTYVDTDRTDATLWLDAETFGTLHDATGGGFFGGWRTGYWLRGNALFTSDAQRDAALGAYAVASKNALDVWFGVRRDWRVGYDRDVVQVATAAAESDLGIVLGVRFGALMLETVQQPKGDASYGQLKFVASGKMPFPSGTVRPRVALEFSFLMPDVHIQLAGRYRSSLFLGEDSPWRQSFLLETRFGEPQYGNDTAMFVRSRQLTFGLEMERQLSSDQRWINYFASLSAGYRSEQLLGTNALAGEKSAEVGRPVVSAGTGLRFIAAALGGSWNYRLQLGLVAWSPLADSELEFAGGTFRVQESALGILLGMTFDYL